MNKMTVCKVCGKDIAKGVKKCVHCGKDQRNFFMKHKIITGFLVIFILGAIGSAAGGNSKNDSSTTASTTQESTTNTTNDTKKDKLKDSYAVGETVKYKGVEMTVTKVEKSNGSDFDKPKDGKEFVIVTVKIKNGNNDKLAYNPFYFKIQNSKGQVEDQAFTTINTDNSLQSGDLVAGGEVEGTIAFEEPIGDAGMLLQYQDNIFSDKVKIQFKIS